MQLFCIFTNVNFLFVYSSVKVCVTVGKVEKTGSATAVFFSAFAGDQMLSAKTVKTAIQVLTYNIFNDSRCSLPIGVVVTFCQ